MNFLINIVSNNFDFLVWFLLSGIPGMNFVVQIYHISILTIYVLGSHATISMKKRRLCVDVVVDNYRSDAPVLGVHTGVKQNQCLSQCVRNIQCNAFHFRIDGGTCEHLSKRLYCMPQNLNSGTVYVELDKCEQYPPRRAFLPPEGNWHWRSNTQNLVDGVHIGTNKYVSRVFERGVYLPGWWSRNTGVFRVARPYDSSKAICGIRNHDELLVLPPDTYWWSDFVVGSPVPVGAVIGGYWMDLSPLYIVKYKEAGIPCAGYNSVRTTKSSIYCFGVKHPNETKILVEIKNKAEAYTALK